jgi:hypothetical protein
MSFQVGVATIAPSSLPHTFRGPSPPWQQPKTYFGTMLLFFLLLSAGLLAGNRSFTVSLWMGTAIVLISLATLLIACGGGNSTASSEGSGTATTGNTGTPAGTYNLTVTGTAFGAARSISLTLTVN